MTHSPRRLAAALSPVSLGVAAVALAGVLAGCGPPPTTSPPTSPRTSATVSATASARSRDTVSAAPQQFTATAGGTTVVVNCDNKLQVRPSSFVLTCADANDALAGMHWVNWASEAFATGTEEINNCTPNCAEGTLISYPVLVALWRPESLPGHPGVQYFSRITRIYTGKRPPLYNCHGAGTPACYPATATTGLWGNLSD